MSVCLPLVWLNMHVVNHLQGSHHCPGALQKSGHEAGETRESIGASIDRWQEGSAGAASQTDHETAS